MINLWELDVEDGAGGECPHGYGEVEYVCINGFETLAQILFWGLPLERHRAMAGMDIGPADDEGVVALWLNALQYMYARHIL